MDLRHCSISEIGVRLFEGFRAALLLAVLIPTSGMSQWTAPADDLRQSWLAVQAEGGREERQAFWQDLDPEHLKAFIEAGVEVTVADRRGWTPLHSAARYNPNPAVLAALVSAGAAVDARDRSGDTPLHWAAAENDNADVIDTLLESGANVNARDKYGWRPIHTAADRSSNPAVIDALLRAGANRNKRAYFVFFRPVFLLKHNANMSDKDKEVALALLAKPR